MFVASCTGANYLPSLDNNPTYVGMELPPVGYARSSIPKEQQISSAFHEFCDSVQAIQQQIMRTHEDWAS